jgi:AraC-like DNA-binding protein
MEHAASFVVSDICNVFRELGVAAAVHTEEAWYLLHSTADVTKTEAVYGVIEARWRNNERSFRRVRRTHRTVVSSYAGFHDVFVPVGSKGDTWGVLVAGPFATSRPTAADILDRWQRLTHTHGRLTNGSFARYLSLTLSTLTLEGELAQDFVQLLERLAQVFSGSATTAAASREVSAISSRLLGTRFAERMWHMARSIIDEHTMGEWLTAYTQGAFGDLKIARLPQHAAVGLLLDARSETDPVEALLRRDAFHRACIPLVTQVGSVVAGRVSDHVLTLLLDEPRTGPHARRKLTELMRRVDAIARGCDLNVHWGLAVGSDARSLPARYQAALAAAEHALSVGEPASDSTAGPTREVGLLSGLRRQLALVARENPALLPARFDRYVEAACRECGYRVEPIRVHFEAGLEQIVNSLSDVGALDEKARAELPETVARDAARARTVEELSQVFRRAVSDLALSAGKPTDAGQQRSIRRATAFIREHLAEPLTLAAVAKAAGFAPSYFSTVFAKVERTPFRNYLTRLRVERSKQMLASTALSIERVGQLVGFPSRVHFHRAFRRELGLTPTEYRKTRKHPGPSEQARAGRRASARSRPRRRK